MKLIVSQTCSENFLSSFWKFLIVGGLFAISTLSQAAEGTQASAKIPVIQIAAENLSPLDIGLEVGRQSKKLFADIERRYDSYLMANLSQMRFDDILRERLPGLRKTIDKAYQKELEGVASSWSLVHVNKLGDGFLSWDEYWLLNLLPDVGLPANGTGFGVLSRISRENGTIIGRNLNLKNTPSLRSLQSINVYLYADRAVVNIGFAGIISVLSGFNESGLFVAHFNAAPGSSYQNPYRAKKSTQKEVKAQGFILRKALETMVSARKAINFIAKNSDGISNNILVADKKNIQVVEYSESEHKKIRHWNSQTRPDKRWDRKSQIAVVDCHVLKGMPDNCRRSKDGYRWERFRSLAEFTDSDKASVQDIASIMLDEKNKFYEILGSNTLQSMIYLPASGHLYLYAAPVKTTGTAPPSYSVYYQDIMPAEMRNPRNKMLYFWWVAGLLVMLLLALWLTRKSIKKQYNLNTG